MNSMTFKEFYEKTKLELGRKPCYFCDSPTVRFKEHYVFCPSCAAIYTNYMKFGKKCEHVSDGTPNVRHDCWFKSDRESKVYLMPSKEDSWICSKCFAEIECDGW